MSISVRRASPKDAAAWAHIVAAPDVFPGLMQVPFPDEERVRQWLTETCVTGRHDVLLVAERQGEVVGTCGLHPVGPQLRRRHAMMLGISVAGQAQNQGVGSALMQAMCEYADHWAQVLRLELTVYSDNEPAIALYRKFGFEVEGTHRAYAMRAGRYVDALAMARLHPNPPAFP
ncbi:GNAT family N-acetyltransferase [Methylibium rhizosphaerae]|uniref:GNAT family N-acetyltransferase n=1 Tax=Methylibium rhizosphaerae TaxID=2570323 RepID=UPI001125E507|nr:GNAT family N-acetyltransferase [Methylibium rhizosphaerae]